MSIMSIRVNAGLDEVLLFDTRTGKPIKFDRSSLEKHQRTAMAEMLVNHYCRMTGQPTRYPDSQGV